jgi:outer membrane protein assembly factor BamB
MHRARLLLVLATIAVLATAALAEDWPGYRGPAGNGIAPDEGINKDWAQKPPKLLWKVPMGDDGYAGPCVADGKLFIVDHSGSDDVVRALDLKNGKQVWEYRYADTQDANYGYVRSTPAYFDGMLYTVGRWGEVLCLKADTGDVVWQKSLIQDFGGRVPGWNYSMSPLVDEDRVVLVPGSERGTVVSLNRLTGETLWQGGGTDGPGYASPVLATILEVPQYVVMCSAGANGVDRETGKLLWQIPWRTEYDVNASNPIIEGNFVVVSSGYGKGIGLFEITPDGPTSWWENKDLVPKFSSPIYCNGYVFGTSESGELVCMSPQNGGVAWKRGGFEWGGLAAVDGTIIVQNGNGGDVVMVAADPAGYQELGRIRPLPGDQCWAAPIIADGKLIVRNKGALCALDLM